MKKACSLLSLLVLFAATGSASPAAPDDSTTLTPLRIGIGAAYSEENESFSVPLLLLDTVAAGTVLHPARFLVGYDATQLTFQFIEAPAGSLLHDVPMTATTLMDGTAVETRDSVILQAGQTPGILAVLYFTAGSLRGADSLFVPLQLSQWRFSGGDLEAVLSGGGVTIMPSTPDLVCSVQAPGELTWDYVAKEYVPNPFTINADVVNNGPFRYTQTFASITYERPDALLIDPKEGFQFGVPDTLPRGGTVHTAWTLRALPRSHGDSIVISIHVDGLVNGIRKGFRTCPAKIYIPRAGAAVGCTLQADSPRVHPAEQRLDPMPFRVQALVANIGGYDVGGVRAAIQLPPGLALAWPDAAGDTMKQYAVPEFNPMETWTASWYVAAPPAERDSTYRIRVVASSAIANPAVGTIDVTLPGVGPLRPRLKLDRDTLDCGSTVPGTSSAGVLPFGNIGALPLHLSGTTITGADSSDFTLTAPLPASLAAGEQVTRAITFTPGAVGAKSAVLRFSTDDPDRPSVAVALIGRGQGAPRIAVDSVVDFGTVRSGDAGDAALDVRNTGTGELRLLAQSIGGADASLFRIIAPAATPIAPGSASRMTLRFLPSGSGPKSAQLMLASNDTAQRLRLITLKGNAGTVGIDDASPLPDAPLLHANRPNPFATATLISFTLAAAADARLAVCDALGREVALLHHGAASAGTTTLRFDAARLPDGLYFALLRAGGRQFVLPMMRARH
jgi:hypothetical protein